MVDKLKLRVSAGINSIAAAILSTKGILSFFKVENLYLESGMLTLFFWAYYDIFEWWMLGHKLNNDPDKKPDTKG